MESSAPLFLLFGGLCPPYFTFWGWAGPPSPPALPPVLFLKYGISYRLLQNFNSFATFNLSSP